MSVTRTFGRAVAGGAGGVMGVFVGLGVVYAVSSKLVQLYAQGIVRELVNRMQTTADESISEDQPNG